MTRTSAPQGELHELISENVKRLLAVRAEEERRQTGAERLTHAVSRFAGSLAFVYVHAALYGGWLLWNSGAFGLPAWDPFPFVMLAVIASVEAIFLSAFVLITQNRMSRVAEKRAELDLHINLLAEYEITKLLVIVDAIADKLGVAVAERAHVSVLRQSIAPERILEKLEEVAASGLDEATPDLDGAAAVGPSGPLEPEGRAPRSPRITSSETVLASPGGDSTRPSLPRTRLPRP